MNLHIGQKIKELRKAEGLNQTQMAEALGVHLQTISRYEQGKLTPGPEVLSVLAEKFGVDVNSWLKTGEFPSTLPEGASFQVQELRLRYNAPEIHSKGEAIKRIVVLLEGMTEEKVFEVLRYAEEKKELIFYQTLGRSNRKR